MRLQPKSKGVWKKKKKKKKKKGEAKNVTLREKPMKRKINTQVPLRQNAEEKGRGKGLEAVWGDENE